MKDFSNDFVNQFMANVPDSLLGIKEELSQWAHAFVSDWLAKHDLVTQQEFAIQQHILARLTEKVSKLEDTLAAKDAEELSN